MVGLVSLGLNRIAHASPGDLDPTFGTGGTVVTVIGNNIPVDPTRCSSPPVIVEPVSEANALVLQADGKLVAAGVVWTWEGGVQPGYSHLALVRYNADGSPDGSFGASGIVTTPIGSGGSDSSEARALILQADGKLVAAGSAGNSDFALVRYNADGSLDETFGTAGVAAVRNGGEIVLALVLQPDGKLVAAGRNADQQFTLARYNADGSLDAGFGVGGIVTTAIGNISSNPNTLVLQPDGKLVAAGDTVTELDCSASVALVRYNPDGSVDDTFGTDGIVTTAIGTNSSVARALVLQPDGKVVAAGATLSGGTCRSTPARYDFALIRYNPNGSLDETFGTAGIVTTAIGTNYSVAEALVLQPDGKLVAAGYSATATGISYSDSILIRYNPDGSLDDSFGTGGIVSSPAPTGSCNYYAEHRALIVQPDGNLVGAGSIDRDAGWGRAFSVVRYLGDSSPAAPTPISGASLLLSGTPLPRSGNLSTATSVSNRLKLSAKDVGITLGGGTTGTPTGRGATLRLVAPGVQGFDHTYDLAARNWSVIGQPGTPSGYAYRDRTLAAGPIQAVVLKKGKLKIVGSGPLGVGLDRDPNPVGVVLTAGSKRYCLSFGGTALFTAGSRFKAKQAPAPATCPP